MATNRIDRTSLRTDVGRRASSARRSIGEQVLRLRSDAGISQSRLGRAAGIDQGYVSRLEAGLVEPSIAVLVAIGDVLGADLSIRLYPTTGPRLHDDSQAAMAQTLISAAHPRWQRLVEVAVRRPARGSIDIVFADPKTGELVATEIQSDLRRLEQHVRWDPDKAESLPSSDVRPFIIGEGDPGSPSPGIQRLLVLRSTVRTRALARRFEAVLQAAYPARTADVVEAIVGDAPWPGHGIAWCRIEHGVAELLTVPPRGVKLGR
jgi:transcriptional regulator with XRE-family HTH domain